jgi:hypothetical protein
MLLRIYLGFFVAFFSWSSLAQAAPKPLEIKSNSWPLGRTWQMDVGPKNWSRSSGREAGPTTKITTVQQRTQTSSAGQQARDQQSGSIPRQSSIPQNSGATQNGGNVPLPNSNKDQYSQSIPNSSPPAPTPNVVPSSILPRSPIQDASYGLQGFETATPIGKDRLFLQFGGASFNNPNDFRGPGSNRSNDAHLDFVYGISKDVQLSVALSGKDDTIFQGLVNGGSRLQILSNTIPVQAKWRFHDGDRLQASAIVGFEAPSPFAALFFRQGKQVSYRAANGLDSITAQDNSIVLGLGLPISYQATDNLRLHLNPRVGFFPSQLSITSSQGNLATIQNDGIGFDGSALKYYGTVFGVGLGASYALSPRLQVAADFTPILAGNNSFDRANGSSALTARPVWNVGLQYAPNNRSALGLYATNRYGSSSSGPSNLLVQPGGDWAVGMNVSYLQGSTPEADVKRDSYPMAAAFWGGSASYPSATLPEGSILYQVGLGSSGQFNPVIRYGVMDDLELAIAHNNTSRTEMAIGTSILGRWGLLPDRGQAGISGALGLGLVRIDGPGLELGYSIYAETPLSYRLPGGKLSFSATPKLIIPAQFQGVPRTLAVSLGADFQVSNNTQIFGSVTPSLIGANQLVAGKALAFQGSTPVYNIGVRQLFPSGNSTYGVELYYGNGAGSTDYQSTSALPGGDTQFGVRFSVLNGTP